MSLTPLDKRTYVDQETIITAANLNDMQDAAIELQGKALLSEAQSLTAAQKAQVRTNLGIKDLGNAINIAVNTDLNDLTTPGAYQSASSSVSATLANCPFTSAGFPLLVLGTGGYVTQVIYVTGGMYVRRSTTTGWAAWAYLSSNYETSTFEVSLSGVSNTLTVGKVGRIARCSFSMGDGTALSSATGNDQIGTLPEGFRPVVAQEIPIIGRTDGGWASATYYNAAIRLETSGRILLRGNSANLKTCKYLSGDLVIITAQEV